MGNIRLDFCGGFLEGFRELFDGLRDACSVSFLFCAFDDEIKSDYNFYDRALKYCESMFVWFVGCLDGGSVSDGGVRGIALILDSL